MKKISIKDDFSSTPGARYYTDGEFSGQEFRDEKLEPKFLGLSDGEKLLVDLDGTSGYATSFLEEAFGGLARKHGSKIVLSALNFLSNEDPSLIQEIESYIRNCKTGKKL